MAIDYFTQARIDYYVSIYKGKTKEQLFIDLNEALKDGIYDEEIDSEQKMKLLVIEEELLKLVPGYELLSFYKTKIKSEKLFISENQFNLKEIGKQYQALLTKKGLQLLLVYSIPAVILVCVIIFVPSTYDGIHVLNFLFFGMLTVSGIVWLLIQPLVVYLLFPFIKGILEIPRVILWFRQFVVSNLKDYLEKHMHKI